MQSALERSDWAASCKYVRMLQAPAQPWQRQRQAAAGGGSYCQRGGFSSALQSQSAPQNIIGSLHAA